MKFLNTNFVSDSNTTITSSSSDPSFPVSNLKHPFRSKKWRSTGCSNENIVFDMRTSEDVDSVVVIWPKETGVRLTSAAVITIQANATNVWTSPAVSEILTVSDSYELASHYFTTDKSYRFWRITIQDPTNTDGYVELGVVWIGKAMLLQDSENGFKYNLVDKSKTVRTDYGHKYVDRLPKVASLTVNFKYLDYEDAQILETAFRTNGTYDPVLFIMDAEGSVFDKDHFSIYGNMDSVFSLSHVNFNILNNDSLIVEEIS